LKEKVSDLKQILPRAVGKTSGSSLKGCGELCFVTIGWSAWIGLAFVGERAEQGFVVLQQQKAVDIGFTIGIGDRLARKGVEEYFAQESVKKEG